MRIPCKNIPTYDCDKGEWTTTSFEEQIELAKFLLEKCFKEPGEYQFHKDFTQLWNKAGQSFMQEKKVSGEGSYTNHVEGSNEFWDFWDTEKYKSRLGVFWIYKERWYYTTRDYYFFINYCPIVNKEIGMESSFSTVRDGQYHMMLYEKIAEAFHQHSVILKKRQFLYSNCHVGKTLNWMVFENEKRIKWFASDDGYLDNVQGSWSLLDSFKNHINKYTGWSKTYQGEYPEIVQKEKVAYSAGKWEWEGNMSSVRARTLKRDATTGVGGQVWWVWYEEGGIAPTADITLQFMESALVSGATRVASFCLGGSVGDLQACKPLKKFLEHPERYGFLGVPTKWVDDTGVEKVRGLFIPVQYSLPEATDEHGNSLVDLALQIIEKSKKVGWKAGEMKGNVRVDKDEEAWEKMEHEEYAIKMSQNPTTIKEAFDYRTISEFNGQRVQRRQAQINLLKESHNLVIKQGLLQLDKFQKIYLKQVHEFTENKPFEMGYPVNPEQKDKRGLVNIIEDYIEGCEYFAGVDSIDAELTLTSHSLFSIHIYRRSYTKFDKTTGKTKQVRGKIVADWTGRFDSTEETNEHGMLLLKMYKAKAACERNKPNFINYCRRNGISHLIALTKDLPFDKDIDVTGRENGQYGVWRDSAGKVLGELIKTGKDYLNSEMDVIYLDAKEGEDIGKVKQIIRGYDQIDLFWTLEELGKYNFDDNFDRVDSFLYAIHYGTAEELSFTNRVITVESEKRKDFDKPKLIKIKNLLGSSRKGRNMLNY